MLKKSISLGLLVFIFFSAFFLLTMSGHYGGDGFAIYLTARSLVLDHDLSINDRPFEIGEMQKTSQDVNKPGSGQHFSKYGIGLALFEVPFVALGVLVSRFLPSIPQDYFTMLTVSMTNSLITALICLVIFVFSKKLGYSDKVSVFLAFAFGLSSFAWPYSRFSMTEPLQTLSVLAAAFFAYEFKIKKKRSALMLAGFLLAFAVAVKTFLLVLLPFFAVYLLFPFQLPKEEAKRFLYFFLPMLPVFIFIGIINYLTFGGFLSTGYSTAFKIKYFEFFNNLYGLSFSSGKGFFFYFPLSILAVFGWKKFHDRHRDESIFFLSLIFFNFLFFSLFSISDFGWHGDWTWGPRYLYLIVPFFTLALAPFVDEAFRTKKAVVKLWLVFVVGVLVQFPAVVMRMADYINLVKSNKLEDLHFIPLISPIFGGWLQVVSVLKKLLFHSSLKVNYVLGSGIRDNIYLSKRVSFAGYDDIDLWFVHIISKFGNKPVMIAMVLFSLLLLIMLSLVSLKKIFAEMTLET